MCIYLIALKSVSWQLIPSWRNYCTWKISPSETKTYRKGPRSESLTPQAVIVRIENSIKFMAG